MLWKRVCAWCNKELGYIEAKDNADYKVTHGICQDCYEYIRANQAKQAQEYGNNFTQQCV